MPTSGALDSANSGASNRVSAVRTFPQRFSCMLGWRLLTHWISLPSPCSQRSRAACDRFVHVLPGLMMVGRRELSSS